MSSSTLTALRDAIHVSTIDRIRSALATLKRAELRVAEAILADIDTATRLTTRELAQRAEVSEPTVVRFARHVGCDGFTDLKRRLSQDFATARMFVFSDHKVISRDAEAVASQVYEATAQALAYAFGQRDPAALLAAALAVVAAERVFCMGTGGSSANIAQEAENRLFRFDVHACAIVDEYKQRIAAAICTGRDALLIFSVTGQPQALCDCARIASAAGAKVIAVTRPGSKLAALSSILLPLQIPDNDRNFEIPNRSRYGQLYVMDCLATLVASRRVRRSAARLRRSRSALLDVHGPTEHQPIGD
jgi:RpiR family transcriptional regulator, carbohydrate utilization regulator